MFPHRWIAALGAHARAATDDAGGDATGEARCFRWTGATSLELRRHAGDDAPLTGDRVRPCGTFLARRTVRVGDATWVHADVGGWACAEAALEPVHGEWVDERRTARVFRGALPVAVLAGPCRESAPIPHARRRPLYVFLPPISRALSL